MDGILKSPKLHAELTIKLHMSNQQQKSEINCPMNVVSNAQIAFKKHIFFRQDQPMHMRSHNVLILRMCIGWSSQVSMRSLSLSFRRWDYFSQTFEWYIYIYIYIVYIETQIYIY